MLRKRTTECQASICITSGKTLDLWAIKSTSIHKTARACRVTERMQTRRHADIQMQNIYHRDISTMFGSSALFAISMRI